VEGLDVVHVVECLTGKCEVLSSNPSAAKKKKKPSGARRWWLMPVILATQEAEIKRIIVPIQPWANSS
jgi:hypothetical protein